MDPYPKAKETKAKINKWGRVTLNRFSQGQPTEQEKIFAIDMTDKALIINIYKRSYNSTSKNKQSDVKMDRRDFPGTENSLY